MIFNESESIGIHIIKTPLFSMYDASIILTPYDIKQISSNNLSDLLDEIKTIILEKECVKN